MTDIKDKLIEKIEATDDTDLLMEVYRLLQINLDSEELYKLSEDQLKKIHEADSQIESGEFLDHSDANKKVEEWLKRQ